MIATAVCSAFVGAALPGSRADAGTVEVARVLVTSITETEVPARETGVLAEISAKVGQMVERGTVLARIDDNEARLTEGLAEVEMIIAEKQAQSEPLIEAAEAAYEVARKNLQRAEESLAAFQRSIAKSEMDEYRLQATEAKALMWQRRHDREIAELTHKLHTQQWKLARSRTERHAIVSPITGMVKAVDREQGEWVTPGDPVVTILQLDRLRCVGFLAAEQVHGDQAGGDWLGRPATLHVPGAAGEEAREFAGTVSFVDPEIEPETGQVKIWVEIDNVGLNLRPGDRGRLTIDAPDSKTPAPAAANATAPSSPGR